MPRTVKPPHVRSAEILHAAAVLIRQKGIEKVSIEEIAKEAGVAKGTFYLYFQSKADILSSLANGLVSRMVERAQAAIAQSNDNALDSFVMALAAIKSVEGEDQFLADALNLPENLELHERANVALVRQLAPVFAELIERGCRSGDFDVDDPLSTIQFILAGQAFLLGNQRFCWSAEEYEERLIATLVLTERALGARKGSLLQKCMQVFA